jgi:hypothetical protein
MPKSTKCHHFFQNKAKFIWSRNNLQEGAHFHIWEILERENLKTLATHALDFSSYQYQYLNTTNIFVARSLVRTG